MEQTDYDALAERIWKRALWVLEAPKERWNGNQEWKQDVDTPLVDAPYEPTGYAKLDEAVKALNPAWKYGGHQPQNQVMGAWMAMREFAEAMDMKYMPDQPGAVIICMPHKADFASEVGYASTVAHELFHWWEQHDPRAPISHGISNPNRKAAEEAIGVDPAYVMEEISAEMGSAYLMAAFDVPVDENERAMYLSGYLNGVPPQFHQIAFDFAKQRANNVLKGITERMAEAAA